MSDYILLKTDKLQLLKQIKLGVLLYVIDIHPVIRIKIKTTYLKIWAIFIGFGCFITPSIMWTQLNILRDETVVCSGDVPCGLARVLWSSWWEEPRERGQAIAIASDKSPVWYWIILEVQIKIDNNVSERKRENCLERLYGVKRKRFM